MLEISPTNGIEVKCVISPLAGNDEGESALSAFDSISVCSGGKISGKIAKPGSDLDSFVPDSFDDLSEDGLAIPGTPPDDM